MADYKRQTRELYFKGRIAHDPSKKLFEESRNIQQRDRSFLSDMEKVSKDYSNALNSWNQNLTELGKEEAAFFEKVTPTLSKLVGEDYVKARKIQVDKTDRFIFDDFAQKDSLERERIKRGYAATFAELSKLGKKRTDLEAVARSLNTEDGDALADYLAQHNKAQDTSIFKMLMNDNIKTFHTKLEEALAGTDKKYKEEVIGDDGKPTGETIMFSGSEVGDNARRLSIVLDEEKYEFIRATQVGGLNTEIIAAFAHDRLKEKTDLVYNSEKKKINIRVANANFTQTLDGVEAVLGEHNFVVNDEGGWTFRLDENDKISPDIKEVMSTALETLTKQAYAANKDNPQEYAYQQLGQRLLEIADGDPGKEDLFEQMLGVWGIEHPNAIKIIHSGTKKPTTIADLNDKTRRIFGSNGRSGTWLKNSVNQGSDVDGANTGDGNPGSKVFIKNWHDIYWEPPDLKNQGDSLYKLDPKWAGTYKYEIIQMHRNNASTDQIEARLEEIAKEAIKNGARPEWVRENILNYIPDKDEAKLQTFLKKNFRELTVGNEIHVKDLKGYFVNKDALNTWLQGDKVPKALKGIVIVDEYSQNEEAIQTESAKIYRKILELSPTGSKTWTPGMEAILDDIIENSMITASRGEVSFAEAVDINLQEYERVNIGQGDPTSQWYQNKNNGDFKKYEGHKDQFKNSSRRNEFTQDSNDAKLRKLDMIRSGKNPFTTDEVVSIADTFIETGDLPLDFLTIAANATHGTELNVIDYLNNLIAENDGLKGKYQKLEITDDLQEILRVFPSSKLNTLYKLTGGDFPTNAGDFNITASRILNTEINRHLTITRSSVPQGVNVFDLQVKDDRPVLPNQGSLAKTFANGFNNGASDPSAVIVRPDGVTQLGKYGINKGDAERIWKIIYKTEFNQNEFLKNEGNIQETITNHFISELTLKQLNENPRVEGTNIVTWTGSQMTRAIIHRFVSGQDILFPSNSDKDYEARINSIGSDVLLENNGYLLFYDQYNTGGTMYNYGPEHTFLNLGGLFTNWFDETPIPVKTISDMHVSK